MRGNDRGRFTVPSPRLYPHQWAWDSAFAALGWAHLDRARALVELDTLMAGAWEDGRIPHILFHDPSADYFPGPGFYGARRSSTISQPPIWATCARRIVEITGDHAGIARLLAPMDASHRWFHERRDPLGWHAIAIVHPWESGMDNSPVWNPSLGRVDVSDVPRFQRRDTQVVGDTSQRPTDEQYLRYAALVKAIEEDGFGPGPFAVYDPFVTAVLARAEDDLAWLARRCGVETAAARRADELRGGLEAHLWDETRGRFAYVDVPTREIIEADVVGCYLPLWCGVTEGRAAALRAALRKRFLGVTWPVPSTAPSDPAYEARRYWSGPTWINVNWMLVEALGDEGGRELAERTLRLIERAGVYEYYDPETGEGLGGERFTWTAALAIDLMERGY